MMRTRLAVALLLSITACADRPPVAESDGVLRGEVFAAGDHLDLPGQVAVVGDRLVVLDRSAPMVHLYALAGGDHLGSFGGKGEGPGEYRSARHVLADTREPGEFWIYDMSLLRLTRLSLQEGELPRLRETVTLHGGGGVYLHPAWLTDSTLVVAGIFPRHPEGRVLVTDRGGATIRTIGEAPVHPGAASIPTTVLQHAYEGPVAVHPDRARFAVATRQADRLEIFTAEGERVAQVVGSTGFLPAFETRQRAEGVSMATGDDLRAGYVDLAATGDHLYALFSGVTRAEAGGSTFFGREVHVFDWAGERVARLRLDEPALTFAVTPDGRQLYAVRHEPEPSIARYALPPLTSGRVTRRD